MESLHLHASILPSQPNTRNPTSRDREPRFSPSFPRYAWPPENIFSDALLSLRKCNQDPKMGSCLHARILKLGIESDAFIGNSLLSIYSKRDRIDDARNLFDHMPHRTIVSWTAMMSAYQRNGFLDEAVLLFSRMMEHLQPNEFTLAVILQACASSGDGDLVEAVHSYAIRSGLISDSFLQSCLLDAYAKSGLFKTAEKLLQKLCSRDVVSWTSVISGFVKAGDSERGLALFCRMQDEGVLPNDVALLIVLHACSEIKNFRVVQWIHGIVLKGNWCVNDLVLNSLMEMYSTNGYFAEAMAIFCCFCFSNEGLYPSPETMANILHGCGSLNLGEEIHGYLIKHGFLPCTVAENSLINMYAENGCRDSASLLFESMSKRDIISWNTIMKCFVKNDQPADALRFLSEIHREGSQANVSPDFVTLLTSLEACSELARVFEGQVIHSYLTKTGFLGDVFIQNALIDMYSKSGRLDLAEGIFEEMHTTDIGSWNSIIAAYGVNGKGASAVKVFYELQRSGIKKPNAITFINVLTACAHAGLVQEGLDIFYSMEMHFGIARGMEHFACVVDLLGRAGRVEEAEAFIAKMPTPPGPDVWGALLSACVLVGNVAVAERAAQKFATLEPASSIWRVALSNAYAAAGKWDEAAEMRAELRGSKKLRKGGGWSSVNIEGCEFSFMAGDTKHSDSAMIYDIIGGLQNHMRDDAMSNRIVLT